MDSVMTQLHDAFLGDLMIPFLSLKCPEVYIHGHVPDSDITYT